MKKIYALIIILILGCVNPVLGLNFNNSSNTVVNKYEKRTEYMEGWNAADAEKIIEILEDLGVDIIEDEFCEPEVIFYE